jgi:hypothetical protein
MADTPLPQPGTRIKCVNNTDRPELVVGQVYVVAYEPDLAQCPINYKRYQPDDWRLISVAIPGFKENGIFPIGIFISV